MRKYSPVPNNSPIQLIKFWIFCTTPLSYLDLPLTNFPDFVLQIFQRLLKRIVLNKEPQKRVNEMEQAEQEGEYIWRVWFLKKNFSFDIAKICY